jgi:urease accessory protein UreE
LGRSKLPDFDAERPPELSGLPILDQICSDPVPEGLDRYSVDLGFGERSRSRLKVLGTRLLSSVDPTASSPPESRHLGIVLPRGSVLRGGAWVLGEGIALLVRAADQDLLEVSVPMRSSAASASDLDQPEAVSLALLKASYHLGNRHVALQLEAGVLKLEYDYVLADMLVAMGLKVQRRYGPFEPEWGAYASGHHH